MNSMRILILAFLLASAPAAAAVRTWVATFGSDANDCSRTAPCRSFTTAIAGTSPGGEVVVLNSGGYGAVTITTTVQIIAPEGVHAAIAPTMGNAITINPSSHRVVILRGLYLNSQGASNGISILDDADVFIEGCVVSGFSNDGVSVVADGASVRVKNTIVRHNGGRGLSFEAPITLVQATLEGVRTQNNSTGLSAGARSEVTASDTLASANVDSGFQVQHSTGRLVLENCTTTQNDTGISSLGTVRVSRSTIVGNGIGLAMGPGAEILSYGNNFLADNAPNGAFTAPTLPLQ